MGRKLSSHDLGALCQVGCATDRKLGDLQDLLEREAARRVDGGEEFHACHLLHGAELGLGGFFFHVVLLGSAEDFLAHLEVVASLLDHALLQFMELLVGAAEDRLVQVLVFVLEGLDSLRVDFLARRFELADGLAQHDAAEVGEVVELEVLGVVHAELGVLVEGSAKG